jgi:hypothetical protein
MVFELDMKVLEFENMGQNQNYVLEEVCSNPHMQNLFFKLSVET